MAFDGRSGIVNGSKECLNVGAVDVLIRNHHRRGSVLRCLIESELPTVLIQEAQEEPENKSCGRTMGLGLGGGMLAGASLGYVLGDDSDDKKWGAFGGGILGSIAGLVFGSLSCT